MKNNKHSSRGIYRLFNILAAAVVVLMSWSAVAHAYSRYGEDSDEKSGRVMLNARGGVAIGMVNAEQDLKLLGAVGLDLGIAVDRRFNAYITFTPQVDLRQGLYNIMIPLGFQYDIRLARGLYLYPRVSIGYSAFISNASVDFGPLRFSATDVTHGGIAIPELGIKYVVNGRFNIGLEPLSIPIFFNNEHYAVWYRVMALVGFNF